MAELITVVESTGQQTWTDAATIQGHTEQLKFRVSGGTFDDDTTEKDISPTGAAYALSLKATITVNASATQPVLVYYQDGDLWVLVNSASRIFMLPQTKELDYRLVTKGFDALPLGSVVNPTYNGLVLGGGVRIPTTDAMQSSAVIPFSQLESAVFDLTKPVSFVYDRPNQTLYWISNADSIENTKIYGAMNNVDLAAYKISYDAQNKRSAVVFHTSGLIETFDEAMFKTGSTQLPYEVNRVVCRRAGVGSNTVDSYVVLDKDGVAHFLSATFVQTKSIFDKFYVNASDSYDVLSTLDGQITAMGLTLPEGVFWYQFVPSSFLVLGYDAQGNIHQFNIRDNKEYVPPRALVANDCVVFNTTAAWTETGGKLVAGMDSNGSDALFSFADSETPVQTRAGWSYVELLTAPYTLAGSYDRLFYYAARPTNNLKHVAIRNYQTVLPALANVELGPTVTFTVNVDAGDPDIGLPVTAPDGVTVSLQLVTRTVDDDDVETVTRKPVTKVYDGQEIEVTLAHEYITSSTFPISIGRTVHVFEMKADDTPNAYAWDNILGVDNDTWNRTADVAITGINVSVPVSVLVDGVEDYSRVKIFVNGVETPMPAYVRNNQTLGFEIQHENNTTRVDVNVGQGSSHFGVYTIVEGQLVVGRNWAYAPIGVEVRSDVMTNTGTIPLVLTITETDAQFSQGGQTVTLAPNATTYLKFTPSENKQYSVKFNSDQYSYVWSVWADKVWLGVVPPTERAERYVMGESDDILFGNIPDNFWTYIKIPAGMLLDVDGVRVVQELDSRGVYRDQGLVIGPFECSETMLKIHGLPSHDQPHTLMLGNAPLPWLYDMTTDPTYEYQPESSKQMVGIAFDDRVTEHVSVVASHAFLNAVDRAVTISDSWFEFEQAQTHANTSADISIVTQSPTQRQDIVLPTFIVGQKDFIAPYASLDFDAVTDIKSDKFDLFEFDTVTDIRADGFDLFEMVSGKDVAGTTMPLPAFITGRKDTITTYPLFEAMLGETVRSDTFWPHFFTDREFVESEFDQQFFTDREFIADTFSNTFVEMLLDKPQYFDIAEPRYQTYSKGRADALLPKKYLEQAPTHVPNATARIIRDPAGGQIPIADARLIDELVHRQQSAEAVKVDNGATYQIAASTAKLSVGSNAVYGIDNGKVRWIPGQMVYRVKTMTGRYVDPLYHPAVIFLPEIPFVRWNSSETHYYVGASPSRQAVAPVQYPVAPAESVFSQERFVASHVETQTPSFRVADVVNKIDHNNQRHVSLKSVNKADTSKAIQVSAPKSNPINVSAPRITARPVIRADVKQARVTKTKVYGLERPVLEAWTVEPDHGYIDEPLKEGYFATELAALQNATSVWGFDPSMVYAIQQVNGYWTWAQITVCDASCGSMSCAARGYLSGG